MKRELLTNYDEEMNTWGEDKEEFSWLQGLVVELNNTFGGIYDSIDELPY